MLPKLSNTLVVNHLSKNDRLELLWSHIWPLKTLDVEVSIQTYADNENIHPAFKTEG